jgi:hypothetical protein
MYKLFEVNSCTNYITTASAHLQAKTCLHIARRSFLLACPPSAAHNVIKRRAAMQIHNKSAIH